MLHFAFFSWPSFTNKSFECQLNKRGNWFSLSLCRPHCTLFISFPNVSNKCQVDNRKLASDDQTRQNAFGIQFWTWWIFDLEIFFLSFDSGLDQNWQVTGHVWGDRGPFLKLILLQKFPCGCKMIFWFWEAVSNYQSIFYNFKAC